MERLSVAKVTKEIEPALDGIPRRQKCVEQWLLESPGKGSGTLLKGDALDQHDPRTFRRVIETLRRMTETLLESDRDARKYLRDSPESDRDTREYLRDAPESD